MPRSNELIVFKYLSTVVISSFGLRLLGGLSDSATVSADTGVGAALA